MGKTLIIGLDGTPWDLIRPWIEEGKLPFFDTFIKNGVHGNNRTTIPSITSPAVPSLYTGLNPGKLGFFDFMKKGDKIISSKDLQGKTIWDYLNHYGKKSLIFNMPITYPPTKINGILVSGYPVPSKESKFTYPGFIKERYDFPMDLVGFDKGFIDYDYDELFKKQKEITNKRFEIFKSLLEDEKSDFAMFFIKGTDILQHYLWHSKEYLEKYYIFLDKKLFELLEKTQDHNIIIFSDHGFEASPTQNFHVNTWLKRGGYLKMKGGTFGSKILPKIMLYASKVLPSSIKKRFVKRGLKRKDVKRPGELLPGVEWNSTFAYKDRQGISLTKNVKNYENTRNEIIEKLRNLKDEDGKPIVREAWKREDVYSGPYVKDVPDILLVTEGDYSPTTIPSKEIVSKMGKKRKGGVELTGAHNSALDGIFMAYGPDIKEGEKIKGANILDIAPTTLHMYGTPIPKDMDGRILKEIFKEDSEVYKRKVKYKKYGPKDIKKKEVYSKEDEEKIKERLKSLGYMD